MINLQLALLTLLSRLPFMPLYYNGLTKFKPIHVIDLVEILYKVIDSKHNQLILECVGPEVLSFREILDQLLLSINKKRLLIPLPLPLAKFSAKVLQLLPKPLLTEDQLTLLKYDNIESGINKTNYDLGIKSERVFKTELDKYSFNWRTGGQFAKK